MTTARSLRASALGPFRSRAAGSLVTHCVRRVGASTGGDGRAAVGHRHRAGADGGLRTGRRHLSLVVCARHRIFRQAQTVSSEPVHPLMVGQRLFARQATTNGMELFALDAMSGQLMWRQAAAGEVVADPLWIEGQVVRTGRKCGGRRSRRVGACDSRPSLRRAKRTSSTGAVPRLLQRCVFLPCKRVGWADRDHRRGHDDGLRPVGPPALASTPFVAPHAFGW